MHYRPSTCWFHFQRVIESAFSRSYLWKLGLPLATEHWQHGEKSKRYMTHENEEANPKKRRKHASNIFCAADKSKWQYRRFTRHISRSQWNRSDI